LPFAEITHFAFSAGILTQAAVVAGLWLHAGEIFTTVKGKSWFYQNWMIT